MRQTISTKYTRGSDRFICWKIWCLFWPNYVLITNLSVYHCYSVWMILCVVISFNKNFQYCLQRTLVLQIDCFQLYSFNEIVNFNFAKQLETRQIWGIWKLRPAYSPETPNLGQIRWCFVPCGLEIWWMKLESNGASLLCCFKLCATFHSHRCIQTGVTVQKRPIWVKFDDF